MNIAGDKMFGYIDRLSSHKPITADVFLTNYCNNKCPYCTYSRWELEKGARYLRYDDFVQYATRLRELGAEGIILTGGGEPTVNPDFEKITGWMEREHINYGINTNFNNLILFKPNYLKVSLDGYNEDSYEAARGVRAYHKVYDNIKQYAEWKKENSPETSLGIQCVATDEDDIKRFYAANCALDVDYIVYRPMESTGGSYYRDKENGGRIGCLTAAIKQLAEHDSRVTLNFKWNMLDWKEKSCTAQWAQIAMNERGEIMYCCHKPYDIVGHIMDADILEKKARAITDMSMCDIPCRMTAPNHFVAETQKERKDACFI